MKVRNDLTAGIFLVIAFVLFAISIFTLGREREIFARQDRYYSSFRDVKGLAKGAPVRLGGITIGRVSEINFSNDLRDSSVHVTLLLNEDYLDRVRLDSEVTLETQGLLGDRFVALGAGDGKQASPGATLKSKEAGDIADVMSKAGIVVDQTAEIAQNINGLIKDLKSDPKDNLPDAVKSISKLGRQATAGDGLVHRLFYSKQDADKIMTALDSASSDLSKLMNQVETGDGVLHALFYGKEGEKTVKDLSAASTSLGELAKELQDVAAKIKSGDGLMHDLVYNKSEGGVSGVLDGLNKTAENLKKASEALASGSGTLGALLIDPQLYDNLVEVTDGAKRSLLLREAIKSSLQK
jgi:phospholipid/cholesterol/gamma-HCH transport system substrate-binding protein